MPLLFCYVELFNSFMWKIQRKLGLGELWDQTQPANESDELIQFSIDLRCDLPVLFFSYFFISQDD